MAAHGLRILADTVGEIADLLATPCVSYHSTNLLLRRVKNALARAPGLDVPIVNLSDWRAINDATNKSLPEMLQVMVSVMPAMRRRWIELDCPGDMEEWRERHYIASQKPKPDEKVYWVDIPESNGEDWQNVGTFSSYKAALLFAQHHFGADEEGKVSLITEGRAVKSEEEETE